VPIQADVPELRTIQVVHGRNGRSAVRREDIRVRTNTWEPVPTIIDSTTNGPWVMPHAARIMLAGDPSGSQGWLIDNAVLVEVLDVESHRLAAALVGNTETMVLDGEPGPTDATALFPEVGTRFLLRVTALDCGGEAYSTDVWLVVGPAEAIAAHAAATIFPGIDLDRLIFDPRPCPEDAPSTPR
jgi:hypothetical protein